MYRLIKKIIKYIVALLIIYLIYNSHLFQKIISVYNVGLVCIVIILSVLTFFILFMLNKIFNYVNKILVKKTSSLAMKSIINHKAYEAMFWVKFNRVNNDINFMFFNDLLYFTRIKNNYERFKNLCLNDMRFNLYKIITFPTNYIFVLSTIFVIYMRTEYIENFIGELRMFWLSNFELLKKVTFKLPILSFLVPIIIAMFYIGRRNRTKNYLKKYDEKIEEEVTLKINSFCTYFYEDLDSIINNLFNIITYLDFSPTNGNTNICEVDLNGLNNELKDIKNANKIRGLTDYLLNSENAKSFFNFAYSRKNFLLFFMQVLLILVIEEDNIMDLLFDSKLYLKNIAINHEKDSKKAALVHIYLALTFLDKSISFMNEFRKYTRSGFFDRNLRDFLSGLKTIK